MAYPTLDQAARAFAKAFPTPHDHPNGGGDTWDQWCGAAMSRFCAAYGTEPSGDVHSAYTVYLRSKIVSKDYRLAVPGDFHFWDIAGPANGHTMAEIFGGGKVFGATRSARSIEGATALGFMTVPQYTLAKLGRARYLGFSHGYADGDVTRFTLAAAPAAAPAPKPLPTIPALLAGEEDDTMILFQAKGDDKVYELKNGRKRWVTPDEYLVLKAARVKLRRGMPAASVARIPNA